ncbi:RDD family protein [Alkalihalobacillus sp. 1P02AB]|uniref:RDD family protein n=1 Tax=Alkalihalobacillus sp. 1P02AB TaxID=3132260 RepID=UPI0039A76535
MNQLNQEQVDIKTPEYVSVQFQSAGLGSRSLAFMIDTLFIMIIQLVVALFVFYVVLDWGNVFFTDSLATWPIALLVVFIFLLNFGYFFIYEFVSGGRTLGKSLIGIRVIQENGHSITLLSSFIRNLLRLVDQLPGAYFLGIVFIFFHPKHKRLGDIVGGTIVVHERRTKKKKKKQSPIDKEIERRQLSFKQLKVGEFQLKSLREKEWNLIKTYAERFTFVSLAQRENLTKQLSEILFPRLQVDENQLTTYEKENQLLLLYVKLKDDWEFDL